MMQVLRHRLPLLTIALVLLLAPPLQNVAFAQFYDDSLDDEQFFQEQDQFFEPSGDEYGAPAQEQDFTEGNEYQDESQVPPAQQRTVITPAGRQFQITLAGEKQQLPLNVAWGAGTGLLIGGWFALINEGNNRETQRAIGTGIVAGIILGAAVGLRTVINPNAPTAAQADVPGSTTASTAATAQAATSQTFLPLVSLDPDRPSVGFRLAF